MTTALAKISRARSSNVWRETFGDAMSRSNTAVLCVRALFPWPRPRLEVIGMGQGEAGEAARVLSRSSATVLCTHCTIRLSFSLY